jgi:hypothetical protein
MSSLGDALGRSEASRRSGAKRQDAANEPSAGEPTAAALDAGSIAAASPAAAGDRSELRRRRDALAEQVTELHWDLGGLAYEMAIRDHFRLDVLVRRAAVLQERDAELAELERLLRLEDSASAGSCPACGAPHSRGAVFCWQCGATLMRRAPSAAPSLQASSGFGREGQTAVIDALLAPEDTDRGAGDGSHAAPFAEE